MITTELVSDDGRIRVERVLVDGVEVGTNSTDLIAQAEHVEASAPLDVLRAQLADDQPNPPPDEVLTALASLVERLSSLGLV
jgi:hypothetical protein